MKKKIPKPKYIVVLKVRRGIPKNLLILSLSFNVSFTKFLKYKKILLT